MKSEILSLKFWRVLAAVISGVAAILALGGLCALAWILEVNEPSFMEGLLAILLITAVDMVMFYVHIEMQNQVQNATRKITELTKAWQVEEKQVLSGSANPQEAQEDQEGQGLQNTQEAQTAQPAKTVTIPIPRSDTDRSLGYMRRHFSGWQKRNSELDIIGAAISQIDALEQCQQVFDEVTHGSYLGELDVRQHAALEQTFTESRKALNQTAEEMRRNFSDIYNLFLAAGAKNGNAKKSDVNSEMLTRELAENNVKLQKLRELNGQVILFVGSISEDRDNVALDAEITVLKQLNARRYGGTFSGAIAAATADNASGTSNGMANISSTSASNKIGAISTTLLTDQKP